MRPGLGSFLLLAFGTVAAACTLSNEGRTPVQREFHYPIAAAISADSHWLYVVNSDFDLLYNGGRVNVVDLEVVRARIAAGETGAVEGSCDDAGSCLIPMNSGVQINPYATAAALRPAGMVNGVEVGARLYVTVRGDGTLTWIDVDGDRLSCGQPSDGIPLCDADHRVGHVPGDHTVRQITLPPLPVTLDVAPNGNILVVHQETPRARASLFMDPPGGTTGPRLVHWLGDLSPNLDAIVRPDVSDPSHYYVFSRVEPTINQLRVEGDGDRSVLYRTRLDLIQDLSTSAGIRDAHVDPCNSNRMYATSRPSGSGAAGSPEQLIAFDISDQENVRAINTLALPPGPSNFTLVRPPGGCGTGPVMAYTVSFDARKIYVIDVNNWREFDEIRTARGPHIPIYDAAHRHLYLVDFSAMVVEVIDVDPTHTATFDRVIYTIGDPVLPDVT